MIHGNRLERALALHLRCVEQGGDWQQLLLEHPELADLLQAFREDAGAAVGGASPARPLPISEIGDYRIERELGRGGYGAVFAAVDRRLGRRVAVKLLHQQVADRPTTVARFLREAQLLARLTHPGIARVLDVGSTDGRPWLAMELVDGESLAERVARLGRSGGHRGNSLRELVAVVAQVADALGHAHRAGIVHRDVKPSNVLLRPDGSAVLTDFGVARDAADPALTQTGVVVGSPHYMAPEQALGRSAAQGPPADVFALGATLYECITLTRAFDGQDADAVVQAVLHRDPPDPRNTQHGLPRDLVAIVQKALEKDPAHRYATADAFAHDLRAFLELREVSARTTTRLTRWLRRARKNPVLGAAAGLGLLLVLVLGWLLVQWPSIAAARDAERRRSYDAATAAGFARREGRAAQFERAIAIAPERPEAIVGLALLARDEGDNEAALATLDRHAHADAAPSLARCRAWLLRDSGRVDDAAALEATLPPPRSSTDLWLRALFLMATSPTPEATRAEALATTSLAVRTATSPNLALQIYWTRLTNLAGSKEQRVEAAESLLRQWPDDPVALQVAGEAMMQYDPKRAIGVLQRALAGGVTDPRCEVSLGFAHAIARDVPACLAQLEKAFRRDDLEPPPRASVLLMLEQLQALEVADRLASGWVAAAPEVPEARRFAGRAAKRRGDLDEALRHLDRAVTLRPDDVDLRLDRIVVYSAMGDGDRQRAELLALSEAHPTHAGVHAALVETLAGSGPRDALLTELRRWTSAKPDDAANWRALARLLLTAEGTEAPDEALAAAERADYLAQGKDAEALALRADAVARLGDAAEAARLRKRAAALRTGN